MRTRLALFVLTLVVAGLAFTASRQAVRAQDKKIVCDADLILTLYIAENNFNYAAVNGKLMADKEMAKMAMDSSKFDYGQFAPLFDGMMKAMGKDMMSPGVKMDEKMMKGMSDMMMMDAASMEKAMGEMMKDTDMSKMTKLVPATIQGEAKECTALRDHLRQYFTAYVYESSMMMMAK
jgi:hypothetical protein